MRTYSALDCQYHLCIEVSELSEAGHEKDGLVSYGEKRHPISPVAIKGREVPVCEVRGMGEEDQGDEGEDGADELEDGFDVPFHIVFL